MLRVSIEKLSNLVCVFEDRGMQTGRTARTLGCVLSLFDGGTRPKGSV